MATMSSTIDETEAMTLCLSDGNKTFVLTEMSSMCVATTAHDCFSYEVDIFDGDNDAELLAYYPL
jgi:hypothetical protein